MAHPTGPDGGAPPQGTAPDSTPGPEAGDAGPGARTDEPAARRPRRRTAFRGHIVVDNDEPLPVFDAPADPPALPADPDAQAPQNQ